MAAAIITLNDIRFRWPGQPNDTLNISGLEVLKGEHLCIKGPSGSGKTTLLNLLTGVNTAHTGVVRVLDQSLGGLSSKRRDQFRADHLGVIFQQFNLLPYLSLLENVQLPCWFSKRRRANSGNSEQTARQLLAELAVDSELIEKPVMALSVGQQQRVAVARALIGKPEIIIADEPTSSLDADNRDRFLQLLFDEADQQGSTLVFVSHDPHIAQQFHRVVELQSISQ